MFVIVGEGRRNLKTSMKVYGIIIYNSNNLSLEQLSQDSHQVQLTNASTLADNIDV